MEKVRPLAGWTTLEQVWSKGQGMVSRTSNVASGIEARREKLLSLLLRAPGLRRTLAPMSHVVTFGEIMMRLTTPLRHRYTDAAHLELSFGGAEANVAVQLAQLGTPVAMVTCLPDHDFGLRCREALRGRGVGVDHVQHVPGRMGVYFVEVGEGQRASRVVYDRQHSAIALAQPGQFDWSAIFQGADWFHWTGITPALSSGCRALCVEAVAAARQHGLKISFDLNYRSALWGEQAAAEALMPLLVDLDLCVCGEDEAMKILGAEPLEDDEEARLPAIAASLVRRYGFLRVAMTNRTGSRATRTSLRAMLFERGQAYFSRTHEIDIVDRIGTGDAFTGALIHAIRCEGESDDVIEFAAAAAAWKHTVYGDWNRVSVDEIESLARGEGGGRIRR